jgi:hypothetical protein
VNLVLAPADHVDVAGPDVVFSVGRAINHLDARTRRVSRLAVASSRLVGLSIEGNRVAWADNLPKTGNRKRARIQAVVLPR